MKIAAVTVTISTVAHRERDIPSLPYIVVANLQILVSCPTIGHGTHLAAKSEKGVLASHGQGFFSAKTSTVITFRDRCVRPETGDRHEQ